MLATVAIDLDGTLLNSALKVSLANCKAMILAQRAGWRIVIASGRAPDSIRFALQEFHPPGISVAFNGALTYSYDGERQKVLSVYPLSQEVAIEILLLLKGAGFHDFGIYCLDGWYANRSSYVLCREAEECGVNPLGWEIGETTIGSISLLKLLVLDEPERVTFLAELLLSKLGSSIEVLQSSSSCLEITASGVNKGKALAQVAPKQNLITIGNGINDISMFRTSQRSFALANSPNCVKESASDLAPSNDDHGVAYVLHLLLGVEAWNEG